MAFILGPQLVPTHHFPPMGRIYPEVISPVRYRDLPRQPPLVRAADEDSGYPNDPNNENWSSNEEATERGRRIAAHEIGVGPQYLREVMGGRSVKASSFHIAKFNDTASNITGEMFGKVSWFTKHVYGKFSAIEFQVSQTSN